MVQAPEIERAELEPVEDVLYAYTPNVYEQQWGPNHRAMIQMIEPAREGLRSDIGLLRVRMVRWRVDTAQQAPPLTPDQKRRVIAALDAHPRYTRVTPADIPANLTMADVNATNAEIARLQEENRLLREIRELTDNEPVAYEGGDTESEFDEDFPDPNIEWEQAAPHQAPQPQAGTPYPAPLPDERPQQPVRIGKSGRVLRLEPCPVESCERHHTGRWLHVGGIRNHARMVVQNTKDPDQVAAHEAWLKAHD